MKIKILKFMIVSLLVSTLALIAYSVKAAPIIEIDIPMLGFTYDLATHTSRISGLSDVVIYHADSTQITYNGFFLLDTNGLDWEICDLGKTIK